MTVEGLPLGNQQAAEKLLRGLVRVLAEELRMAVAAESAVPRHGREEAMAARRVTGARRATEDKLVMADKQAMAEVPHTEE